MDYLKAQSSKWNARIERHWALAYDLPSEETARHRFSMEVDVDYIEIDLFIGVIPFSVTNNTSASASGGHILWERSLPKLRR